MEIKKVVINKKTETALNAMINDKLSVLSVKNSVYRYVALKQFYQVKSVQKNEEETPLKNNHHYEFPDFKLTSLIIFAKQLAESHHGSFTPFSQAQLKNWNHNEFLRKTFTPEELKQKTGTIPILTNKGVCYIWSLKFLSENRELFLLDSKTLASWEEITDLSIKYLSDYYRFDKLVADDEHFALVLDRNNNELVNIIKDFSNDSILDNMPEFCQYLLLEENNKGIGKEKKLESMIKFCSGNFGRIKYLIKELKNSEGKDKINQLIKRVA
ncbi:hypothetical protein [Candidatus Regiella insecticola]|nr:hypothetical protein [Candidatus Regiella insecticola]